MTLLAPPTPSPEPPIATSGAGEKPGLVPHLIAMVTCSPKDLLPISSPPTRKPQGPTTDTQFLPSCNWLVCYEKQKEEG